MGSTSVAREEHLGERRTRGDFGKRTGVSAITGAGKLLWSAGRTLRGHLRDAEFAEFYCADNGRDSVPPSLLATALLLQSHDKVSDSEAKARADFDLRWKVALGIEVEDRPFAKSTLQVFRAQLILHDKVREVFESSLRLARESGYRKRRGMRVALDTTNILGRGAVKDTATCWPTGPSNCCGPWPSWATSGNGRRFRDSHRYLGSSIKGEAAIDWSDRRARKALLAEICRRGPSPGISRQAQPELPEDSAERQGIVAGGTAGAVAAPGRGADR